MTTVMVLSGRERRRPWPAAEKLRIVEESLGCEAAFPGSRAGHGRSRNLLHRRRRLALIGEIDRVIAAGVRFGHVLAEG